MRRGVCGALKRWYGRPDRGVNTSSEQRESSEQSLEQLHVDELSGGAVAGLDGEHDEAVRL